MSTNISKEKREKLISEIKAIREYISAAPQDENTGNLLTYLSEIEKDIKGKKYGLVFEEHRESIDDILATHTPVLSEDTDLFIDNGGQMNFLIEGDNLASLQLLEKTHKGRIDLIYIDPPYNTGRKDFIYDDIFVDINDSFRHSKWLSFMSQRLICSSHLLKSDGILMISIDDRELFNLKVLCDDILGEQNFVSCLSCQSNPGGDKSDFIEGTLQYVLVYAKNKNNISDFGIIEQIESSDYKLKDNIGYYKKGGQLEKWGNDDTTHTHPNLAYSIYFNPKTGDVQHLFDYNQDEINSNRALCINYDAPNEMLISQGYVCIRPRITNAGENGRWRLEPETFYKRLRNNGFIFEKTKSGYKIYEKDRLTTSRFVKAKNFIPSTIAKQESKELLSLFNRKVFDYPKPLNLMTYLIGIVQKSEATILDFFAGSGTTGHAVMKLNAEDGGNRKFILCTNNENDICRDITYERIKRVINKEGYNASLKYYKIDYIPISDMLYYEYADELLKHIRELVELENGVNFTGNNEIANLSYKVAVRSAFRSTIKVAVIPKMYNDAPVTEIATNGFYSCQKLERIYIPKSIKKIGNNIQLKIH